MRNLLITITILISNFSNAQNYIPMLGDFTEWYVGITFEGVSRYDFYTAEGDTTIDNHSYKFLNYYHFNKNFVIREDTDSGKVYIRIPAETNLNYDYLVYDFSLEVGDSIEVINPIAPAPFYPGIYYVDSIKEMEFYQDIRKVLFLSQRNERGEHYNFTYWIEGIGSASLVNSPGEGPDLSGIGVLKCYYKDSQPYYIDNSDTNFSPCTSNFNGLSNFGWHPSLSIYPNPAKEYIIVGITGNEITPTEINIVDLLGRTYYSKVEQREDTLVISISHLPSGIYLLRLSNKPNSNIKFIVE